MSEPKTIEILKHAILLERRGKVFYKKISEETDNKHVSAFFEIMAEEEQTHMYILGKQYNSYKQKSGFEADAFDNSGTSKISSDILNREIKDKISAASFEATAILAAISMEERAIKLYSQRTETTIDPEEKQLYEWLTTWEREHLNMLVEIDKDLVGSIWFDNNFWKF